MKNNKTKKSKTRKAVTLRVEEKSIPIAKNYTVSVPRPRIRTDGKMGHVARTEKLLAIDYQAAVGVDQFNIYQLNPGLIRSFPEGANMAKMYDRYRFTKLVFTYIPSTSTAQSGTIRFAYDEDPSDQSQPTTAKMAQMSLQKTGNVREKLVFSVPAKMLNSGGTWRRTRVGPVSGSLAAHDSGLLWVAYDLSVTPYHIGDIFVEYEIDYVSNTPIDQVPEPISALHVQFTDGKDITPTGVGTGQAAVIPFGVIKFNTIYAPEDGGTYYLEPAYYRVTLFINVEWDNSAGVDSDTLVFDVLRNNTVVATGYLYIIANDFSKSTVLALNDFVVNEPAELSFRVWCDDPLTLNTNSLTLLSKSHAFLQPLN